MAARLPKVRGAIMIEPTEEDIGRSVVYTGNRYPGGKLEEGVITSFHDHAVFVRYCSDKHSKATSRADLDWVQPTADEKWEAAGWLHQRWQIRASTATMMRSPRTEVALDPLKHRADGEPCHYDQ